MSVSSDVGNADIGLLNQDRKRFEMRRLRFMLLGAIGLISLVLVAGWFWRWYSVYQYIQTTDDAYLAADSVRIAPRVNGYVDQVAVVSDQPVKAGQLLFRIESDDLKNAVTMRQAELTQAQAELMTLAARIDAQQAMIAEAGANLRADQSSVEFMRGEAERYKTLAAQGVATKQRSEGARSDAERAVAMTSKDQASIASARAQSVALTAQRDSAVGAVEKAKAALAQASLELGRTEIRAPIDGVVGDVNVRLGQYANAGTSLLSVVPLDKVYLSANFKETQVAHMVHGSPVKFTVDACPDVELTGIVDGLAPGTGAQFSLLPPENATGNFTKVVQRVPVRILIDRNPQVANCLRPGLSAAVGVDTRR